MFIVTTQGLENYGAHSAGGKFADGTNYWKFKSGSVYLVEDLDREQDAMAFVAALAMENGIGWKEYPCNIQTVTEWADELPDDAGEVQSCRDYYLSTVLRVSPLKAQERKTKNDRSWIERGIAEWEVA